VEILPAQVGVDSRSERQVKRKADRQFSVGGGSGSLDKVVGIADITEGNLGGMAGWAESGSVGPAADNRADHNFVIPT